MESSENNAIDNSEIQLKKLFYFFKLELNYKPDQKEQEIAQNKEHLHQFLLSINKSLSNISKEELKSEEGIKQLVAYIQILNYARSNLLSVLLNNNNINNNNNKDDNQQKNSNPDEKPKDDINGRIYNSTKISLCQNKENNQSNSEESESNSVIVDDIISGICKLFCKDQKYVDAFMVPVLIYNDIKAYKSQKDNEKFWNKYVEELSQSIYSIFLEKAILISQSSKLPESQKAPSNQPQASSNNQQQASPNQQTLEPDFTIIDLDFSPILTESNIIIQDEGRKNLSFDISKKLIQYIVSDLKKIYFEEKTQSFLMFEFTAFLLKILNLAISFIYEDGAEIPPLNFILKCNGGNELKNKIMENIYSFINDCIIEKNVPFNYYNQSFVTPKEAEDIFISNINQYFFKKSDPSDKTSSSLADKSSKNASDKLAQNSLDISSQNSTEIASQNPSDKTVYNSDQKDSNSILDVIEKVSNQNKSNKNYLVTNEIYKKFDEFNIDSISSIALIIGKKRMKKIVSLLFKKLKAKIEQFCAKYRDFIPMFNFKINANQDRQSIYALKQYFDSFIVYFNLPFTQNIISNLSKIGSVISLIIMFDSAITSEFIPKDMISASISPLCEKEPGFSKFLKDRPSLSNHNYFFDAMCLMYKILNEPENRVLFDEINGHSAFYQFAIPLIYSCSHKLANDKQTEDSIAFTDSVIISCSIIIELLTQYYLFSYSNVISTFILYNDKSGLDIDIDSSENNFSGLLFDKYKWKLTTNLQIVDTFHYALARSIFPAPNCLVLGTCDQNDSEKTQENKTENFKVPPLFAEPLLHRCKQLCMLLTVHRNKGELPVFDYELHDSFVISVMISISIFINSKRQNSDMRIRKMNNENNIISEEKFREDEINSIISQIRSVTHQEFGDFFLVVVQKKTSFTDQLISLKDILLNLRGIFPIIIDNDNYMVPQNFCNPLPIISPTRNYVYS